MSLSVGMEIEITVMFIDTMGNAYGIYKGYLVFVEGAVVGKRYRVRIEDVNPYRKIAYARIIEELS